MTSTVSHKHKSSKRKRLGTVGAGGRKKESSSQMTIGQARSSTERNALLKDAKTKLSNEASAKSMVQR